MVLSVRGKEERNEQMDRREESERERNEGTQKKKEILLMVLKAPE